MSGGQDGRLFAFCVGVAGVFAAYYFVSYTAEVLMPFALAAVVAYLVNPAITVFEARGWRRDRLVPALYLSVLVGLILAANVVVPWAIETVTVQRAKVPQYMVMMRRIPDQLEKEALTSLPMGGEQAAEGIRALKPKLATAWQAVPTVLLGLLPLAAVAGLMIFVSFFALIQGPQIIQGFVSACPNKHVEKALSLISQVDFALGNYTRGLLLEAAVVSAMTWAGLLVLGINFSWEIALLCGVTNMVPYLGPVVGGAAGAAVAYFQFKNVVVVGKVLALFGVVQFLDNWIVQPIIMQNAVELHPVAVIFVLLVAGQLFGFFGLIFAVPAACILKEFGRIVFDWYIGESGGKKAPFSSHALRIPYV